MVSALQSLDTNLSNLSFSGGNVGVGSASPLYLLHLKGTYPYVAMQDTEDPNGSI